jgi:hypothetical protein
MSKIDLNDLCSCDRDKIAQSVNRRAMMALFAELLGWMSNVRQVVPLV